MTLTIFSILAGIALVLALVGIYSLMSYSVMQRTHEIGIRMAIGAQPRDVFKMILGQGMILALIRIGVGLVGAYLLTRFMATMLFSVTPTDPATFAVIAAILATVALLACYLPGRRATKVEPVVSLRYEEDGETRGRGDTGTGRHGDGDAGTRRLNTEPFAVANGC